MYRGLLGHVPGDGKLGGLSKCCVFRAMFSVYLGWKIYVKKGYPELDVAGNKWQARQQ